MTSRYVIAALFVTKALLGSALAYGINFEDRPPGPRQFSHAGHARSLRYGFAGGLTATIRGGTLLTNETFQSTDDSSVYATSYFGVKSLKNPLTISFNRSVSDFQVDIVNAFAGHYVIYDNVGDRQFFSLARTGSSEKTVGFAEAGTKVSIEYLDGCQDFAIDNIVFSQALSNSPVPLPSSAPMFGAALMALGAIGSGLKRRERSRHSPRWLDFGAAPCKNPLTIRLANPAVGGMPCQPYREGAGASASQF